MEVVFLSKGRPSRKIPAATWCQVPSSNNDIQHVFALRFGGVEWETGPNRVGKHRLIFTIQSRNHVFWGGVRHPVCESGRRWYFYMQSILEYRK